MTQQTIIIHILISTCISEITIIIILVLRQVLRSKINNPILVPEPVGGADIIISDIQVKEMDNKERSGPVLSIFANKFY